MTYALQNGGGGGVRMTADPSTSAHDRPGSHKNGDLCIFCHFICDGIVMVITSFLDEEVSR